METPVNTSPNDAIGQPSEPTSDVGLNTFQIVSSTSRMPAMNNPPSAERIQPGSICWSKRVRRWSSSSWRRRCICASR